MTCAITIFQGARCSSVSDKMMPVTIDSVGRDTTINAWVIKTLELGNMYSVLYCWYFGMVKEENG